MTIAKHWATVKNSIYSDVERRTGTAPAIHYEFLSTSAIATSAFALWTDLARPGQRIKLIASAGNDKTEQRALAAATRMKLSIPTDGLVCYKEGDVVAELRIPSDGISLRRTSSVGSKLAKTLRPSMPFALPFELTTWFTPGKAQPFPGRRVPYALSSFGVTIPGAVACKSHTG